MSVSVSTTIKKDGCIQLGSSERGGIAVLMAGTAGVAKIQGLVNGVWVTLKEIPVECPVSQCLVTPGIELRACFEGVEGCIQFFAQDVNASAVCGVVEVAPPPEPECAPFIASFKGDEAAPSSPFNIFGVHSNGCCELTITTDAGSVIIPKGVTTFQSDRFDCELTSISVSGDCASDATIFIQNTGK